MKPMLAGKTVLEKLRFPIIGQPKIDGIRFLIRDGEALSRTLKRLPNQHLQSLVTTWPTGLDGEVTVGEPFEPNVMQATTSGVMTYTGQPHFVFTFFDVWNHDGSYIDRSTRLGYLVSRIPDINIRIVASKKLNHLGDLLYYMEHLIDSGYEGMILRDPNSRYKFGRSTSNEQALLKYKHFVDDEAVIISVEELLKNGNAATTGNLGQTERSHHKANMIPMNTMGALIVQSDKWPVSFGIGTGFDANTRKELWNNRDQLIGKTIKFKYFETGMLNVPRFPIWIGFRPNE